MKPKNEILDNKKVKLTLILQNHPNLFMQVSEHEKEETRFSQFRIMQELSHPKYKNYVILTEGNFEIISHLNRNNKLTSIFKEIFPNFNKLEEMDYENLTNNQKEVLGKNDAVSMLFHLGLVDNVYPAGEEITESDNNIKNDMIFKKYCEKYRTNIVNYPNFFAKSLESTNGITLKDFFTYKEKSEFKKFYKEVKDSVPEMYNDREVLTLNYILKAAINSDKNHAVLVFGADHMEGFEELIRTKYYDTIELKEIIRTNGLLNKSNQEYLDSINKEAVSAYKKGNFNEAIFNFKDILDFWYSTNKSNKKRNISLLSGEFNLGSALFQLAKIEGGSIDEAIFHLENANNLANLCEEKNGKYSQRYLEALEFKQLKEENLNIKLS